MTANTSGREKKANREVKSKIVSAIEIYFFQIYSLQTLITDIL